MNQRSTIEWTPYLATAYAEGFCEGENAEQHEVVEAWAYLINTGLAYQLQGFFGRYANALIEEGLISKLGEINWDLFEERIINN